MRISYISHKKLLNVLIWKVTFVMSWELLLVINFGLSNVLVKSKSSEEILGPPMRNLILII